jgi:hypothetical protein
MARYTHTSRLLPQHPAGHRRIGGGGALAHQHVRGEHSDQQHPGCGARTDEQTGRARLGQHADQVPEPPTRAEPAVRGAGWQRVLACFTLDRVIGWGDPIVASPCRESPPGEGCCQPPRGPGSRDLPFSNHARGTADKKRTMSVAGWMSFGSGPSTPGKCQDLSRPPPSA